MSRCYDFDHRSYYNLNSGRIVPIRSIVGQAQFFLSIAVEWITAPNEQLLLCRFANTIHRYSDEREVRQLRQLAQHLDKHRFEGRHGYVNPVVGREVEREIILRQAMDCAAGYDLTQPCACWPNMNGTVLCSASQSEICFCAAHFASEP